MRLPEDTYLGHLQITDVYAYYDGPRLFAATNSANRMFLALSVEETKDMSRWLFSPLSKRRLQSLVNGDLELRSAFVLAEDSYVYDVSVGPHEDHVVAIKATDISPEDLPNPGEFLLGDSTLALLEGTQVAHVHAAQRHRETLRLALRPHHISGTEAPSWLVGQVLVSVQELVSAIGQAIAGVATTRGRINPDILKATELRAVGSFAGSFGVELVAAESPDPFGGSLMADSLAALDSLLDAGANESRLADSLDKLRVRAASKYVSFISLLVDSETDMTFDWGSTANGRGSFRKLNAEFLFTVSHALSLSDISTKTTYMVTGTLIGLNTRTGWFEIEDQVNGDRIIGRADKDRFNFDQEFTITGNYCATVEETVDVSGVTGKETITRLLVELVSVNGAAPAVPSQAS